MRYIAAIFSMILILFSCDKEDIIDSNAPFFICEIEGNNFSDNTPIVEVNAFDMISIDLSDDVYSLSFRIYNFSTININDTIYFSTPSMGMVTHNGVTYSNFYNPPYDGELVFSDISTNTISGFFHFKAQDVDPYSFININVTNGLFENISY